MFLDPVLADLVLPWILSGVLLLLSMPPYIVYAAFRLPLSVGSIFFLMTLYSVVFTAMAIAGRVT
jgi:hypothetical protein